MHSRIASSQGPKSKILHVCSSSNDLNNAFEFFSCGEKHAIKWTGGSTSASLQQENIKVGSSKSMFMAAGCLSKSYVMVSYEGEILGVTDGSATAMKIINEFSTNNASNSTKEKEKDKDKPSFNCIWTYPEQTENRFITGGKDGKVIIWEANWKSNTCKAVKQLIFNSAIRAVCMSVDKKKILVGTQACSILETSIEKESNDNNPVELVIGHFKEEVWGLAVRPPVPGKVGAGGLTEGNSGCQYCSAGDDGFVRLWDTVKRTQLAAWNMECKSLFSVSFIITVKYTINNMLITLFTVIICKIIKSLE